MAMERWRPFGSALRWEPAGHLGEIQAEVNRLFDSFFGRPTSVSMSERVWMPVVDLQETENEVIVSRSEEHTSELQSHLNLVCRLLLEKKNTTGNKSMY